MLTRRDVISQAADQCMKELYSLAQPSIEWDDFIEENKKYIEKEKKWNNLPEESRPDYKEFMGPSPYEFYYLPKDIMTDVCNSYIYAYRLGQQQELLDTIEVLKKYCEDPIVEKWIKEENGHGYKSYDRVDNLETELQCIIKRDYSDINEYELASKCISKFFEFLDKAGSFYNWDHDFLNSFNISVYLGASPNSNKEIVIKNWKQYRNQDIEIDEEQIKKEYYGEEY